MKFNINGKTALKVGSVLLGIAVTVLQNKSEQMEKAKFKEDIKKEILNDLSK